MMQSGTQMNKIKKEFLGKWVLGAPESAMQVLSMWLMKKAGRLYQWVQYERWTCQSTKAKVTTCIVTWWWWRFFVTSLIDRYAIRPLALQNICLATFAVTYDVIQSSTQTEETEDVNAERRNVEHRKW